jgi:hypothetical protein
MTATTFTATRADLVKALDQARREAAGLAAHVADLERQEQQRKAKRREYDLRYIERVRAQAPSAWTPASTPALPAIPADPDAARHRADLLAALRRSA